ncbi:MAG: hypothetical protein A3H98_06590 [Bacteroidetes bacterium RIFCSPLOWO2_02_FULL_36_8]|nr:MAG: hypothetical protein A3H98_06590 [Bacteroidetes bacterium RIFCSPLOWO2_02_FULL_36_8]OFY71131.1 MAG: hypothetical protein A3G23_15100 [Bacteroidetes bacterium RIFCSPLOWO2_12_FULL_37_12]
MVTNLIKTEFKKRRTRQYIVAVFAIPIIVLMAFISKNPDSSVLGEYQSLVVYSSLGLIVCIIGFTVWNWRCPNCNKYFGKSMNPKFCQHCGSELK